GQGNAGQFLRQIRKTTRAEVEHSECRRLFEGTVEGRGHSLATRADWAGRHSIPAIYRRHDRRSERGYPDAPEHRRQPPAAPRATELRVAGRTRHRYHGAASLPHLRLDGE